MEFKGTKTEWYLRKMKNEYHIHTEEDVIAKTSPTYLRENGKVISKTNEEEANAKLIASSPDLLEALLKVKEVLKKEWPLEDWEDFDKEIGYSKVINKALN